MSRTEVFVECPFGRDTSWITQEICEDYAGASLKGTVQQAQMLDIICNGDMQRKALLIAMLDKNQDFEQLKNDLIDEYGIEHFIKTKSRLEHIRDIEQRMEEVSLSDGKTYAALVKELRELKGWVEKPSDKSPTITVNNINQVSRNSIDRSDPKALERYVMSVLG